jgi:mannosyltransferase OCH1-like enzyme
MTTTPRVSPETALRQTIPAVLHQTWKTTQVPQHLQRFVRSWTQFQTLEYHFHTDEDSRRLIANHFPQYLEQYDRFTRNIERADFARYAIMAVYGGIYADLDMECIRSIEPWLQSTRAVIGTEPEEHADVYRVERVLCNAILMSPPGHPVWGELMAYIVDNYQPDRDVVYNTGPMAMTRLHQRRPDVYRDVEITEPTVFYPVIDSYLGGRSDGGFDHVSRSGRIAEAYTVHHWVHTYMPKRAKLRAVVTRVAAASAAIAGAAWWWLRP